MIIEALACGTYVICTDLPGIRNWIDQNLPDNGVVFVEPPRRVNEDEPVEEELPVFEKKLAGAIEGDRKISWIKAGEGASGADFVGRTLCASYADI